MNSSQFPHISIEGAQTNNLKNISLNIPHYKFIVVTGLSGSGKSSLVFDIIAQEGQRRYFETLPSFARQFMGKLNRPEVAAINGLAPVIAIGQGTSGMHARSTVGTMSDIYDLLRLLYARTGKTKEAIQLSRALFSFNSEIGKCQRCNGIGKEEKIDLNKLISDPDKTLREGTLAPSLPNGYIMYSQVTIDVLNEVCEAEGFNVDIPWKELTTAQQNVILYGSEKIKVPFGKHSLESRLKWTGIKAKPREKGFYKGMIPIMSDILRRDRNANILKYVHAVSCGDCNGARLNQSALSVTVQGKSIAEVTRFELSELKSWIATNIWGEIATPIVTKINDQVALLEDLGLGHLTLDRSAKSLSASEIQRIRVANQILVPLSDVLYVFDEPSIGLHPDENEKLIQHFKRLLAKGNTVIVVEHDVQTIANADHIIELGPKAGIEGGELIFNGSYTDFIANTHLAETSPTYRALHTETPVKRQEHQEDKGVIQLLGCSERNLKEIDISFKLGGLNIVSGKSGAGKSSLVKETLFKVFEQHLEKGEGQPSKLAAVHNIDAIDKLIFIDHTPIGRTPRSNPATYLGISDHIRDLFSKLPEAKEKGISKSKFSFNNKGGRCETCQGAGKIQIGMHFLGNVELVCGSCNGDRFNQDILAIKYKGLSIADCYRLSINKAVDFFEKDTKILKGLKILQEIGLGYLTLGQSSTTLSGGEAQRIKIANQLQKKDTGNTLYVIIEPSIGLHHDNITSVLQLFNRIKKQGNTIVCIEQDETIISHSDWHIEMGPGSGKVGGSVLYQGEPRRNTDTIIVSKEEDKRVDFNDILLNGVTTHQLKHIDVRIPKHQLTVVTGRSGSGKSSLVYDTLFAESNARFTESLSTYNRSFLQQNSEAVIESFSGLGPAIGINRKGKAASKRSTVGTLSGVYDALRLLYSRIAQHEEKPFTAQHFSFNHHLGACPSCEGLGVQQRCQTEELIVAPEKSIFDGCFMDNKALNYYTDLNGQFIATLKTVGAHYQWNLERPWKDLEEEVKNVIWYGTGEQQWEVVWEFKTKSRSGTQSLTAPWLGLCNYIDDEYERKRHNKNTTVLEALLHDVSCSSCNGSRLKPELLQTKFLNKNIYELSQLSIATCLHLITSVRPNDTLLSALYDKVIPEVRATLKTIKDLGLGYLNLNRSVQSLSGGERQRVTLAGQLSSQLFGVTYVLDEPTIGLDQDQVTILNKTLRDIVNKGNTVVVVEHDKSFIEQADYVIEMGPEAGHYGGRVMYQGKIDQLTEDTLTYKLLHEPSTRARKELIDSGRGFGVKGARANNLKAIAIEFHSKQLIAVTGVSGSGKSSLIKEVLYRSYAKKKPVNCDAIFGFDQFDDVLLIDQESLSQQRLMTPASYTGILDLLKAIYAKTETAKQLGLKKADFSYQSKNGKCPTCAGHGKVKVSMDFMSDLWLNCDRCNGMRYHEHILACEYREKSIGEVLQMTVAEAIAFFESGVIVSQLEVLKSVGLGHLSLGQAGNTLSGGESQRLKLANAMLQKKKGTTLFLFDEPSTGLHHVDLLELITVFEGLVAQGDTVLFIEHNSTLIAAAHQLVRLGPGSGEEGGIIIN